MLADRYIYQDIYELSEDLECMNGSQARKLLNVISEVKGNYDNAVLNKYLDTLYVHIIYALGRNVLKCLE